MGHNTLPNFIGRYFPRSDDPDIYPFYCASMLMLLKPWRDLTADLKDASESWPDAFIRFKASAPKTVLDIDEDNNIDRQHRENQVMLDPDDDDIHTLGEDTTDATGVRYSEAGLEALISSQTPWREEFHGRHAVEQATVIANATGDDLRRLIEWKAQMDSDVNAQNLVPDMPHVDDQRLADGFDHTASVDRLEDSQVQNPQNFGLTSIVHTASLLGTWSKHCLARSRPRCGRLFMAKVVPGSQESSRPSQTNSRGGEPSTFS